ncbi:hypothetical protein INS49_001605 [Diaporthe citri]|uniref:uncharacterized protein n=1 Tax=Diaporthe citri TaxID=83186 RepID=UPI001C815C37|nr:uncharacterized protein INS49_001605 [Diaporthe citri]KAG6367416.1 hypothetical protein INS49_001605 [Diaporthe citri]
MANAPVDQNALRLAVAFNPDMMRFNCFFVALGRIFGVDSKVIATWVQKDVNIAEVNNARGADLKIQKAVQKALASRRLQLTLLSLANPRHAALKAQIDSPGPHSSKKKRVLEAARAAGLLGRCLAIGAISPNRGAHFVTLEYRPRLMSGGRLVEAEEWCLESDGPVGACKHCKPDLSANIDEQEWIWLNIEAWTVRDYQAPNLDCEAALEGAQETNRWALEAALELPRLSVTPVAIGVKGIVSETVRVALPSLLGNYTKVWSMPTVGFIRLTTPTSSTLTGMTVRSHVERDIVGKVLVGILKVPCGWREQLQRRSKLDWMRRISRGYAFPETCLHRQVVIG